MKKNNMYGLNENMRGSFERLYKIELTEKTFERTESGKSWRKKPIEESKKVINFDEYYNTIEAIPFFRNLGGSEKITKGYTAAGFLPIELISTSPDKETKIVRNFKITSK